MEQPSKLFTATEATHLLEQVRPLLEQLQRSQRSIVELTRQLDDHREKISAGNGHPVQELQRRIDELTDRQLRVVEECDEALKRLQELGGVLKDLSQGLVDFYSMRDGKVVFLCWRLGEAQVGFWHSLETGFASRQPV